MVSIASPYSSVKRAVTHYGARDALGVVTGAWLRFPDGLVKRVDLWEIIDAVLLDESEAC